jgi:hypothetical protein
MYLVRSFSKCRIHEGCPLIEPKGDLVDGPNDPRVALPYSFPARNHLCRYQGPAVQTCKIRYVCLRWVTKTQVSKAFLVRPCLSLVLIQMGIFSTMPKTTPKLICLSPIHSVCFTLQTLNASIRKRSALNHASKVPFLGGRNCEILVRSPEYPESGVNGAKPA